ncbi:dTDP-glucose 4,6-dehydratase [Pigmentiphaga aceris]|uniref:dTDP-glucose 4,6-dehydratase n=1 Tax=Pigmentiphaga aceris TaxID=1940612 RepID=A0A5C0B1E4_9BURK|nr:dTDP-glucose 4,6-dehydratase [Pigmentiphaga aceris]QEI08392.1 dTDP-glucose 4,6-dehydratase [Pigmentiphaga aceris]
MILISGGAGFIGSNFVHHLIRKTSDSVVNIDALTYAGNLRNLADLDEANRHVFLHGDIRDAQLLRDTLTRYRPKAIINFAAESHVDRSIAGPQDFVHTNVLGTFQLLSAAKDYWTALNNQERDQFRFIHISTDEVYGTLHVNDAPFTERHAYSPNSPYAATKAASDHLVRSYFHTYGFPAITTNCSNNYGARQFPEKLIPLCINNALTGKSIPIYGDGNQIRDWLYVDDHCAAIQATLEQGTPGEVYNIGGWNEKTNLEVVSAVCGILDNQKPRVDGRSYADQITFVRDRPGHDRRYAIDASKIEREIGWRPAETFDTGIRKTVQWYLDNQAWVADVTSGAYRQWINKQYADN